MRSKNSLGASYISVRPFAFNSFILGGVLDSNSFPGYGAFTYVSGSAGKGLTHKANRAAFEKWQIIPRMLVNATRRDLTVSSRLFCWCYPNPVSVNSEDNHLRGHVSVSTHPWPCGNSGNSPRRSGARYRACSCEAECALHSQYCRLSID
jgi:FMN-dependent dehydrogenase